MKSWNVFLLAIVMGLASSWLWCPAYAQDQNTLEVTSETTPSTEEAATTSVTNDIQTKPDLSSQITELQATYRQQLEAYQAAEREFVIAKNQYAQLKTLAALNSAIEVSKQVMTARANVLQTYVTLLRTQLLDADGVQLSLKEQTLQELDAHLITIADHQQTVAAITDRATVTAAANQYSQLIPRVEQSSYLALQELAVAKLQVSNDKLSALLRDIQQQPPSQVNKMSDADKARAFQEIAAAIERAQTKLQVLNAKFTKNETKASSSSYASTLKDLQSVYADQSQAVAFLEELLQLK